MGWFALLGKHIEFVFDLEVYRELVKCLEDGSYVVIFSHLHKDPGSAVLD